MEYLNVLLIFACTCIFHARSASCPGAFNINGYGSVSIVPTGWDKPGGGTEVKVLDNGHVVCNMNGRAYFADTCTAGVYNHNQYAAHKLLGKTMRYTTDMSGAGCGCNAAFYLTSLRQNTEISTCNDYYCDANKVCGVWCAEIDIQEANQFAWHSTLHSAHDRSGVGAGYGGGGAAWNGPREWTSLEYGPGKKCIDSSKPFQVAASFPVDAKGVLIGMEITLSQEGRSCPLSVSINNYADMVDLSKALDAGMTPILSYWKANDMLWMDGKGKDGKGPCAIDNEEACPEAVQFYNFSVEKYVNLTRSPSHSDSSAPVGDYDDEGFCCLAAPDSTNVCGKCFSAAKALKGSHCGASKKSCNACGSKATWCAVSAEVKVEEGFCCLAATDKSNACGTCFPAAKAKPSSHCGMNKTSCHACGSHATWCKAEEGHCCMAAKDQDDFCGTCFETAIAAPSSHCGGSEKSCHRCGGRAKWCKTKPGVDMTKAIKSIGNDKATDLTKDGHVIIHVESNGLPADIPEGTAAKILIGDAPPLHVKVVKIS